MKQTILLAALLAAAPAFAQNAYVTGQAGSAQNTVGVDGVSMSNNDTGAILAAGYRVTPNFALEAGYAYLGKFSKSAAGYSIYAKPTSVYGALVGTLVATPQFSLSAKVGVANNSVDVGYNDGMGGADSTTVHKTGALFGVGAAYNITPAVAVVAEYTHFGTVAEDQGTNESVRASILSAGVRFSF